MQIAPRPAGRPIGVATRCSRRRLLVKSVAEAQRQQDDAAGAPRGPRVKLSFTLPYRTEFGQDIGLVGNKQELGEWDPQRGVSMRWHEGDMWRAEVEVAASDTELEYKYVVRNPDGNAALWKPGDNYRLSLSNLLPVLASRAQRALGAVGVRDSWDEAIRDVSIEVADAQRAMRPTSEAVVERSASLAAALGELATQMVAVEDLMARDADPLSPQMLQADRTIAAAARKVAAAATALQAAQAAQGQLPEACSAAETAPSDATDAAWHADFAAAASSLEAGAGARRGGNLSADAWHVSMAAALSSR